MKNEHGIWTGDSETVEVSEEGRRYHASIHVAQTDEGWEFATRFCVGTVGGSYAIGCYKGRTFPTKDSAVFAGRQELADMLIKIIEGPQLSTYTCGDMKRAKRFLEWLGFKKETAVPAQAAFTF